MKSLTSLLLIISFCSCTAFRYGYTKSAAQNIYRLVTTDKNSIGNKRLVYNIGYHSKTQFSCYIENMGYPDFIYEYRDNKCDAINLYYLNIDSVFQFAEQKKNRGHSTRLVGQRAITDAERMEYQALLTQQHVDSISQHFQ